MRIILAVLFIMQGIWSAFDFFKPEPTRPETPDVDFASPVLDAGTQQCNSTWSNTARLTNLGRVPIRITEVSKSCGCTEASLTGPNVLQPGESTSIAVTVKVPATSGQKSTVEIVCGFVSMISPMPGVAAMRVRIESQCEETFQLPSTSPVPDPRFVSGGIHE